MNEDKKYYAVTCKCGHVTRCKYIPIIFALVAKNGKEAARIARQIPRCKHDHKDCILNVDEITYEEYLAIRTKNNEDPYLMCHNIQEQNLIDLDGRLVDESSKNKKIYKKEITNKELYYHKEKIRNPKVFVKNYNYEGDFIY